MEIAMNLKCFDKVIVDKPEVSKESIKTRYTLEYDGKSVSYELRNKYETNIIGPNIQMHANLMATVPAINEGLFADDIILNYDLTPAQYQFFSVMLDKMCREIFVNEFLTKPLYIKNEFLPKENDIRLEHVRPRARLYSGIERKIYESVETDNDRAIVRDLQIIKIPFMMSSNFKTGGIEDEDIGTGSEWRILTDGGLGYSFG